MDSHAEFEAHNIGLEISEKGYIVPEGATPDALTGSRRAFSPMSL
jgi:hypothetical protein